MKRQEGKRVSGVQGVSMEIKGINEHYASKDIQPVDVAEAWGLNWAEFTAVKYLFRRGKKGGNTYNQDMCKAVWYLVYCATHDKRHAGIICRIMVAMMEGRYPTDEQLDKKYKQADSNESNPEFPFEHWSN